MIDFLIGLWIGGAVDFLIGAFFAGRGRDDRDDQ